MFLFSLSVIVKNKKPTLTLDNDWLALVMHLRSWSFLLSYRVTQVRGCPLFFWRLAAWCLHPPACILRLSFLWSFPEVTQPVQWPWDCRERSYGCALQIEKVISYPLLTCQRIHIALGAALIIWLVPCWPHFHSVLDNLQALLEVFPAAIFLFVCILRQGLMWPRLALNSFSLCLDLPSVRITGLCYHAQTPLSS